MRDIKFRAWHEKLNKMIYDISVCNSQSEWSDESGKSWIFEDDIMQFTGLKDKNGKEIYEGDIMQHANPFDIPFVVNWIDSDCGYGFNYGTSSYHISDRSFTVIGNIYENPELLK